MSFKSRLFGTGNAQLSTGSPSRDIVGGTGDREATTQRIATVLLWCFVISVLLLFIINIFVNNIVGSPGINEDRSLSDRRKEWFELLKNSIVLLGTTLTTIIGYYFGQREGTIKAEQAEKRAEGTEKATQKLVERITSERDLAIKNASQESTASPDIEEPPSDDTAGINIPS